MAEGPHDTLAQAAAAIVAGMGDSIPCLRGAAHEIRKQIPPLVEWATREGRLLDYQPPAGCVTASGAEHQVYLHADECRVYKRTWPGTFGSIQVEDGRVLRIATPYFYLRRLMLTNHIFDSDLRLEAITPGESPSIVISQPAHAAADVRNPLPSLAEVTEFLRAHDFEASGKPFSWFRRVDRIYVADARPDNFILTSESVVPIDLIVGEIAPGPFPQS